MTITDFQRGPSRRAGPMALAEGTRVRLTRDVREQGRLHGVGSTGTIVHVYRDGVAFEVEITHPGHDVVTAMADALEATPS